jgi:anaerobic magnesium-protoporphyrin IX monomethyl ester cyclase
VRLRSPANVFGEIKELFDKYKINEFMFYDDTFTINTKRAADICNLIIKNGMKIRFYMQSRADTMDLDLAILLKKAGCIGVAVGVESGDKKILAQIGKRETKEQFRKAVEIFKQAGLPCVASYVIGLPGDTHETIKATIDFANELDTDQAKFMIATPYPGTQLYEMAKEKKMLKSCEVDDLGDYTYYQHVAANLSNVTDEELMNYQRSAYDSYDKRKKAMR